MASKWRREELKMTRNLLRRANAFAEHRGCALATVGRIIHGDSYTFDRIKTNVGSITLRKYFGCMEKFDKKWPDDLAEPELEVVKF